MTEPEKEPQKTRSAGGVVLDAAGNIALVRNGPGLPWWGFPKGHLDPGEDALTAARREIHEETGLSEITLVKPLGSYERYKGAAGGGTDMSELKHIEMFFFSVPGIGTPLTPLDHGNPEARWVPKGEVAAMLTNAIDREFFLSVLDGLEVLA